MSAELHDILDVVNRLEEKRDVPPARLPRQHDGDRDDDRDRDGHRKGHGPLPPPRRDHRPHSTPLAHSWDWRSKGGGP